MTLTIELPLDVENRLRERAERQGAPVSRVAAEALTRAPQDWAAENVEDDLADLAEAERISDQSDPAKRRSLTELKRALGR